MFLVFRMDVRPVMLLVVYEIQRNDDPVEHGYYWHGGFLLAMAARATSEHNGAYADRLPSNESIVNSSRIPFIGSCHLA